MEKVTELLGEKKKYAFDITYYIGFNMNKIVLRCKM